MLGVRLLIGPLFCQATTRSLPILKSYKSHKSASCLFRQPYQPVATAIIYG